MEYRNLSRMANRAALANRALRRGNVGMAEEVLSPYVRNNTRNIPKMNYRPAKAANLYIEEDVYSNAEKNANNDETITNGSARSNSNASSALSVAAVNENYSGFTPNVATYLKSKGITPQQFKNNMAKAKARSNARKATTTKKRGFAGQFWNALTRKGLKGGKRRTYRRRK